MKYQVTTKTVLVSLLTAAAFNVNAFEELGKVKLEPMEKPAPQQPGKKWHVLEKGEEIVYLLKALDGDYEIVEKAGDCTYTQLALGFAPSASWENCKPFDDGTQKITKIKGELWPLSSKTKVAYTFSGQNKKGDSWHSTRKCSVKGQVKVSVPAGEFDTYKLVCKDKWNARTWWISPELGDSVAFKRNNYKNNSRDTFQELVKVVNP